MPETVKGALQKAIALLLVVGLFLYFSPSFRGPGEIPGDHHPPPHGTGSKYTFTPPEVFPEPDDFEEWKIPPRPQKPRPPGSWQSSWDYDKLPLPDDWKECMSEEAAELADEETAPQTLAGFVTTADVHYLKKHGEEYDWATSIVRCWAQKHGYLFYQNVLENSLVPESGHFFGRRWQSLLNRHIRRPMARWIIHFDSDTVVANMSKSADSFLEGNHDVLLQIRRQGEVTAAMVGFRTESPFARCFLRKWIARGATGDNSDNGDLVKMLYELFPPADGVECEAISYGRFITKCFVRIHQQLESLHEYLPIKVETPHSGWWRSHEGHDSKEDFQSLFFACIPNDLFVHGWKLIGEHHHTPELSRCVNTNETEGPLKRCLWADDVTALRVAKKCCYYAYAGCMVDGENVCLKENPACQYVDGRRHGWFQKNGCFWPG